MQVGIILLFKGDLRVTICVRPYMKYLEIVYIKKLEIKSNPQLVYFETDDQ